MPSEQEILDSSFKEYKKSKMEIYKGKKPYDTEAYYYVAYKADGSEYYKPTNSFPEILNKFYDTRVEQASYKLLEYGVRADDIIKLREFLERLQDPKKFVENLHDRINTRNLTDTHTPPHDLNKSHQAEALSNKLKEFSNNLVTTNLSETSLIEMLVNQFNEYEPTWRNVKYIKALKIDLALPGAISLLATFRIFNRASNDEVHSLIQRLAGSEKPLNLAENIRKMIHTPSLGDFSAENIIKLLPYIDQEEKGTTEKIITLLKLDYHTEDIVKEIEAIHDLPTQDLDIIRLLTLMLPSMKPHIIQNLKILDGEIRSSSDKINEFFDALYNATEDKNLQKAQSSLDTLNQKSNREQRGIYEAFFKLTPSPFRTPSLFNLYFKINSRINNNVSQQNWAQEELVGELKDLTSCLENLSSRGFEQKEIIDALSLYADKNPLKTQLEKISSAFENTSDPNLNKLLEKINNQSEKYHDNIILLCTLICSEKINPQELTTIISEINRFYPNQTPIFADALLDKIENVLSNKKTQHTLFDHKNDSSPKKIIENEHILLERVDESQHARYALQSYLSDTALIDVVNTERSEEDKIAVMDSHKPYGST